MSQHHRNLGIRVGASKAEIKKAYRLLAMRLHPDKNPDQKAAELFAELQDSYDALMNPLPQTGTGSSARKTDRKEKTAEQRQQEARKRYEEHMRREKASDERYFQSLMTGYRGLYYKIGRILCGVVLFSCLLDFLLPKHAFDDEFSSFSKLEERRRVEGPRVSVGLKSEEVYTLSKVQFYDLSTFPKMYVEKSRLLHLPVQILHPVQGVLLKYKIGQSLWSVMPLPFLLFVFPAILLFYKKRTPGFTALYMVSTYFVFPLTLLFLLDKMRWLHIITLGFF